MKSSMIQSIPTGLASGGTVDGDLTISGDLQVNGGGSLSFDEIVQGTQVIDVTNTEALLVRKNDDGGDVFVVDTTNSRVGINKTPTNSLHLDIGNGTPEFGKGITIETGDGSYTANRGGMLEFHNEDVIIAGIRAERPALGGFRGDLQFFTHSSASGNTYGTTFLERMRITNEGNVGIGTASPDYKLKVEESTNGADCSIAIRALNDGGAGRTAVLKVDPDAQTFTLGTPNIVTDISNERLGIGTTSPSGILSIFRDDSSTVGTNDVVIENDGSGDASLKFSLTGATDWYAYVDNSDSDKFKIRRSTTDHLSIDESGNATFAGDVTTGGTVNVIGASSATATLNINANNGASTNNKVRFLKETGAEFKLQMNTGGVSSFANLVNFKGTGTTFNNNVTLASSTSSSPFLTIENTNADDNMGGLKFIKDSASPNTGDKLMQIWAYGDNDYAEQILYSEIATLPTSVADGSEEGSMRFRVMNAGSFVETMRIRGNKVGIGTSSPDNELHITDGSAGSVTANSNSQVTIESNSHASLQFLSPNNANSIIYFGDADDNDVGYINYAHSSNTMNFQTATAIRMSLDANSRISLSNNDSGTGNTIFGKSASPSQAGSNNTIMGENSALAMDGGEAHNIVIGSSAMRGADEGASGTIDFNVVIGNSALWGASFTGSEQLYGNIAIGYQSLNKDGDTNSSTGQVAIGHQALKSMTSGNSNTAIGYLSGTALTTASNNTAVGYQSLHSAQTSQNNVAVGYLALEELTFNGNSYNTALGVQSGQELTSGIKNTFVGAFSGGTSTDVDNAVIVGYNAGGAVMTDGADGTVAIGTFALDALTSGARNLAVGYNAGTGITTGTDNCLVGWGAGDALLTNASNNTIIGAEAEASSTGASDQIVIGKAAIGQGTNTVVLGKSSVTAIYCARNASASVEASAFNVGSDRKLKKNIRDTALQGINLIEKMQVRDFEWKDNDVTVNGGLIAQELEAIYPDAVGKRNDDGDDGDVTMTISRESIVPLLIKAVQELTARVKELESK